MLSDPVSIVDSVAALAPVLSTLSSWVSQPQVLLSFFLGSIVFIIAGEYLLSPADPPGVPLIREKPGARTFSLKTRLAYYTDCKNMYQEAYDNYSKKGKMVIVPGIGLRRELIFPPSWMPWIVSQPPDRLGVHEAFTEANPIRWSLGSNLPIHDGWQGHMIKSEVARAIDHICHGLNDELKFCFDKFFGVDTENWREVDVMDVVPQAVAQASARFTVGRPLCREDEYIQASLAVHAGMMQAAVNSGMPVVLKPLIGRALGFLTRSNLAVMAKYVKPLWRERIQMVRDNVPEEEQPLDHIQMMARFAVRQRPHEVENLDLIVRRIVLANFAAVHQTVIQTAHMLTDIVVSDAKYNTVATLSEEVDRVLSGEEDVRPGELPPGMWNKARVNKMIHIDSAAREAIRINPFGSRAILRKIMVDGFTAPDGTPLPKGTIGSILTLPLHNDEDLYPEPAEYDPFRWSRMKGESNAPVNFVSTSPEFMVFGHGKNSCPGRPIVEFEMKMIVAHVLRNYDIKFPDEYKGQRPPKQWMTEVAIPQPGLKLLVKRKTKA